MNARRERTNRTMLRVRDALDRDYATDLGLEAMARLAHVSPDHLIRTFKAVFGETPHRYLQRRRIERAMFLLRTTDRVRTGPAAPARPRMLHDGVDAPELVHEFGHVDFGEAGRLGRRLAFRS